MSISAQDRARIATAIRAVEAKTSGEIVCVLAHASAGTTALPVFIAAVAALALPWLLVATTDMAVDRILSLQVVVFLGLMMLFALPRVRVALSHAAATKQEAGDPVFDTGDLRVDLARGEVAPRGCWT